MTDGLRLGLHIDGVDIFEEFGINIKSREIGTPSKKKVLETVAHSSRVFDFSNLYGGNNFNERKLTYVVNIIGNRPNRVSTAFLETEFNNFLMHKNQFKLIDDIFPGYYFLAEVRDGTDFNPILTAGELTLPLTAYPFKIKSVSEGSFYWDDYSVLDIYQPVNFKVPRTTFKRIDVGSTATVGAWSTHYDGEEYIPKKFLGASYTVTDVRVSDQAVSKYAYFLSGLNKWVIEQDIVQANVGAITINVVNTGSNAVTPTLTTNSPITIIRGAEVYNFWAGKTADDRFQLNEGDNLLLVGANNARFDLDFHKELI